MKREVKKNDLTTEEIIGLGRLMKEANKRMQLHLKDEAGRKMLNMMIHKKIKSKNIQLLRQTFMNVPYVYKDSENHWWGYINKENPFGELRLFYEEMKRVYTSKGYVYFTPEDVRTDSYLGYTTHFFDRYSQRMGLKNKDAAIRHFLKALLMANAVPMASRKVEGSKRRENVLLRLPDGVGLGTRVGDIIIIMTFVTNELLARKQLETVEQMDGYFQQFMEHQAVAIVQRKLK